MEKLFKILVVALAVTVTQAFAGVTTKKPTPAPSQKPEYFNGFYLGLGGGLVKPNAKIEYDYEAIIPSPAGGFIVTGPKNFKSNDSGKFGIAGNVLAGFGKIFNSKYLGIEVFGNLYEPDMKNNSNLDIIAPIDVEMIFKTKIKNDYSYGYGALIRGGYLISPKIMFYILFGIDQSKFEVTNSAKFSGILIPTADALLAITDKFQKTKTGYLPGIGIETFLNDQFSLKLQYMYTFYSSLKHTVKATEELITKTYTTKVNPSRGMISLTLSRYFG